MVVAHAAPASWFETPPYRPVIASATNPESIWLRNPVKMVKAIGLQAQECIPPIRCSMAPALVEKLPHPNRVIVTHATPARWIETVPNCPVIAPATQWESIWLRNPKPAQGEG